jgi:hypothetical protein
MNKEWMPVNPCLTCTNTGDLQDKNYCKNHCSLIIPYTSAVNYQRKLLEHLRSNYEDWDRDWVSLPPETIPSMLKQLEEK